jgi:hypothetical protein
MCRRVCLYDECISWLDAMMLYCRFSPWFSAYGLTRTLCGGDPEAWTPGNAAKPANAANIGYYGTARWELPHETRSSLLLHALKFIAV